MRGVTSAARWTSTNRSKGGPIDASSRQRVDLTDSQAILIRGDECRIVE